MAIIDMSTRYNNGSHYENHQRAAELHDGAAHAHRVGEQHGKQDHLTGHEHSRQALDHDRDANRDGHGTPGEHRVATFGHTEIEALAHELWKARGCPQGSPDVDWLEALKQLRTSALSR
jgi:hypothetical protein